MYLSVVLFCMVRQVEQNVRRWHDTEGQATNAYISQNPFASCSCRWCFLVSSRMKNSIALRNVWRLFCRFWRFGDCLYSNRYKTCDACSYSGTVNVYGLWKQVQLLLTMYHSQIYLWTLQTEIAVKKMILLRPKIVLCDVLNVIFLSCHSCLAAARQSRSHSLTVRVRLVLLLCFQSLQFLETNFTR